VILRRSVLIAYSVALAGIAVCALASIAYAQGSPFGVGPARPPAPGGFSGWIFTEQARFYRALSSAIRAAKADGSAAAGLFWLSFLYGVFHAAGPGHGKAVISSYLLADGSTIPRGIALSGMAALAQAVTAIALVGIAAIALGATARAMGDTVRVLELGAYGLIVAFGLVLAWRKGRALIAALAVRRHGQHGHDHGHHHHDNHGHDAGHEHDHVHGPEPAELKGRGWLKRGLVAVAAVGMRPCSGAIIVLVFALSQGIFAIGVIATLAMAAGTAITVAAIAILAVGAKGLAKRLASGSESGGVLALRALELTGAVLIVAVGVLLITGLMASERMFPA
jgi:ABC-type nickel/cobalt efflux system permease component RcnA